MRILLVTPPARRPQRESIVVPPLGLMYIATVLRQAGFDVQLKDAFAEGLDWDAFGAFIRDAAPDVLGISGMSPVIDTTFRAVKLARPHVRHVVLGGPHASLYRAQVFQQCPEVDVVVVGEGETTAVALMQALADSRPLAGIPGVVTRTVANPDRPLIADVDTLPYPDRSLIRPELFRYPFSRYPRVTTLFTSRGCPYGCTFCDKSTFGSKWRPRSAPNVLGEIDEVVERFGIRSLIFYDDLFTVNRERVAAICEGILQRGYRIEWKCEGRVNLADLELMRLMKRAGCSMIAYGVESANPAALAYLNKRTTPEEIERAFALTRQAGLKTMAYFILGIPVETYADELRTIAFARRIRPTYAQFSVLSPYYGTRVYEDAVARGWYREIDAQNPLDKDLKRPVVLSDNWTEADLQRIVRDAHRQFYFRPGYILRYAFALRSFAQIRESLRVFLRIFQWLTHP